MKIKMFDMKKCNEKVINKWLRNRDVEDIQINNGVVMIVYNESYNRYANYNDDYYIDKSSEDRMMLFP